MTADTDGLMLEHLRCIRASQERNEADVHDIKLRMFAVEMLVSAPNGRMDRFGERLTRIVRRLDFVHV